jgi:hypothetical protein
MSIWQIFEHGKKSRPPRHAAVFDQGISQLIVRKPFTSSHNPRKTAGKLGKLCRNPLYTNALTPHFGDC